MVSPLISALLGAGEQYMADEDASDQLKGDIIDAASKKYFDVELPQQKGVINAMKEVKRAIANEYGNKVADIGDNYGYFEDGNLDNARARIEKFIGSTTDTKDSFMKKSFNFGLNKIADAFEKRALELYK